MNRALQESHLISRLPTKGSGHMKRITDAMKSERIHDFSTELAPFLSHTHTHRSTNPETFPATFLRQKKRNRIGIFLGLLTVNDMIWSRHVYSSNVVTLTSVSLFMKLTQRWKLVRTSEKIASNTRTDDKSPIPHENASGKQKLIND